MGLLQKVRSGDRLACLSFDSGAFLHEDVCLAISDFSRGLYCYSEVADEFNSRPFLRLKAWSLGKVSLANFSYSKLIAKAPAKIDPEFANQVILRVVLSGRVNVEAGDMRTVMRPGNIYLLHPKNTLEPQGNGTSFALRLPMEEIGYDPLCHPMIMPFSVDGSLAYLVMSSLYALFEKLPDMNQAEALSTGPLLCDLIKAMLTASAVEADASELAGNTQQEVMQRHLIENLRAPDLGVEVLQSKFGASRATIYRAFADEGGVSNFIRRQKLHAVERELRRMPYSYGCLRRVAESYGFFDQSAFSKSFKSLHGFRPSDIFDRVPPAANTSGPTGASDPSRPPALAEFWKQGGRTERGSTGT